MKKIIWIDDDSRGILTTFGIRLERRCKLEIKRIASYDEAEAYINKDFEQTDRFIIDFILPTKKTIFKPFLGPNIANLVLDRNKNAKIAFLSVVVGELELEKEVTLIREKGNTDNIKIYKKTEIINRDVFADLVDFLK